MSKIAIMLRHSFLTRDYKDVGEDKIMQVDRSTSIGEVYDLLEKDSVDHIEILEQKYMPEVENDSSQS